MNDLINVSKLGQNKTSDLAEKKLEIPQNIDAEQALLGALLVNNEIFDKINHILGLNIFLILFIKEYTKYVLKKYLVIL